MNEELLLIGGLGVAALFLLKPPAPPTPPVPQQATTGAAQLGTSVSNLGTDIAGVISAGKSIWDGISGLFGGK